MLLAVAKKPHNRPTTRGKWVRSHLIVMVTLALLHVPNVHQGKAISKDAETYINHAHELATLARPVVWRVTSAVRVKGHHSKVKGQLSKVKGHRVLLRTMR